MMNNKSMYGLMVLALAVCLFLPAASSAERFKIIVIVNGTPITGYDVEEQMALAAKSLDAKPETRGMTQQQKMDYLAGERSKIVERMIEEQLMQEEIERLQLSVSEEQVDGYIEQILKDNNLESMEEFERGLAAMEVTLEQFREKIHGDMLKNRLVKGMVGNKLVITDTEVEEEFAKDSTYDGGSRAHIRAIMVSSAEEMDVVVSDIDDGKSFAEAAQLYSKGPVPEEGGDMGHIAVTNLAAPWQEALLAMEPGDISEPFESEGSFVMLELIETTTMSVDDVPGMRDKIFRRLRQEKMSKLYDDYMNKLREMAVVEWK